jgi:hypothetical protein
MMKKGRQAWGVRWRPYEFDKGRIGCAWNALVRYMNEIVIPGDGSRAAGQLTKLVDLGTAKKRCQKAI